MKQFIRFAPLVLLVLSCTSTPPLQQLKDDVAYLASDALEGRKTGTQAEIKAAEYIAARFDEIGLNSKGTEGFLQPFRFKPATDPHSEASFSAIDQEGYITGVNVIGFHNNNAENTVVIGAHYDHLGYGGEGSLYRDSVPAIHNGADDNASGVATLLTMASNRKKLGRQNNYLFIAFSGEEMGLLGSNYFVKNSTITSASINYMINMDMVGRLKEDNALAVYGVGTTPLFNQTLNANNTSFKLVLNESGIGPSDHTSFYLNDIPVLHFFTGQHEDYHKPSDDAETLNYEGMFSLSEYLLKVINTLDRNGKLAFRATKNESEETPRFTVGLGVVPDYLYDGKGMRIDGVSEGKIAQKVGLQKGDIVIGLGSSEITTLMEYMKALSAFKKEDQTTVTIQREGVDLTFEITF